MLANSDTQNDDAPPNPKKRALNDTWSPEQETALLLDLCEAQMDAAIRDSDGSVDVLVKAFTELVDASRRISALAKQMPTQLATNNTTASHDELKLRCDAISAQVNNAIVAFQFYDKLSQRLGHVRHSLTTLAMFICDRTHAQEREHWLKLVTALRRLYRTAEERAVFDLVAEGATADEVRASVRDHQQAAEENAIEFF